MKDLNINNLIDEKIKESGKGCIEHNNTLMNIQEELIKLVTYNEVNYKNQEAVIAETRANSTRLTVIETRSKTKAGFYFILVGIGGFIMWIIDKFIELWEK